MIKGDLELDGPMIDLGEEAENRKGRAPTRSKVGPGAGMCVLQRSVEWGQWDSVMTPTAGHPQRGGGLYTLYL